MIVVDASAAIEVLLRTAAGERVEQRLFAPGETLHAPHLIDVEVVQVLRRYAMAGQLDIQRCREAMEDLADFPLHRYPDDFLLPRIWELRENLAAYDAAYIALTEVLDARLVTRDQRLAAAPGPHVKVEVI